jgi:hypothetical protein
MSRPTDDDGFDFPPTKYPMREAITMAIVAVIGMALMVIVIAWLV